MFAHRFPNKASVQVDVIAWTRITRRLKKETGKKKK
jgi:hypothetical protein